MQYAQAFEGRLARFGIRLPHFAEEVKVRGHHDSGAKVGCRGKVHFVGEVVGKETHGDSSTRRRITDVALRPGDIIRIESIPDGEEHAAPDYVEVHLSPE